MENSSSVTNVTKSQRVSYNGAKFSKLLILSDAKDIYFPNGDYKRRVLCKCDCGKEKELTLADIKSGRITSCGCYKVKVSGDKARTHGMRWTRFYSIYLDMKKRCENPNNKHFKSYGGRGIRNEFGSFEFFMDAMLSTYSDALTLERIDVNGNYSPCNCKWIPMTEQGRNKRDTIRYNGEALISYCERNNLNYSMVRRRLKDGWDIELAIRTPKKKHRYDPSYVL